MRVGVLMTCFNRRDKTVACLAALGACRLPPGVSLEVFLVDDGSTDGTTEAVTDAFPAVTVLRGDGSLFWNGGMRRAFEAASSAEVDGMLWLNDDTILMPHALEVVLDTYDTVRHQSPREPIVVGATCDGSSGRLTYGGQVRKSRLRRTTFSLVSRADVPVECETLNGNCVFVPAAVFKVVGNLDPGFVHALGDLDYGLRARALGFPVWVSPGFVGTCSRNSVTGTFADGSLPMRVRLKKLLSPKGLPPKAWQIFTKRHCGVAWPVFWLMPYVRLLLSGTRLVRSPAAATNVGPPKQGSA